jgi:hypothetical protein
MHTKCWFKSLKGTDYSKDLNTDRRIILKWVLGCVKLFAVQIFSTLPSPYGTMKICKHITILIIYQVHPRIGICS